MSQTTCCLGTSFISNNKQKHQQQKKAQPNEYQKIIPTIQNKNNSSNNFRQPELLVEFKPTLVAPTNKRLSELKKSPNESVCSSKDNISIKSLGKKCTVETIEKDIADFVSRVNKLRFIDESSTSSIISTPAGSVSNLTTNISQQEITTIPIKKLNSNNQQLQIQQQQSDSTIELSQSYSSSTLTDSEQTSEASLTYDQEKLKLAKTNTNKYPRNYLAKKSSINYGDSDSSIQQEPENSQKPKYLKIRTTKKNYQNLDKIIQSLNSNDNLNNYFNIMENALKDYSMEIENSQHQHEQLDEGDDDDERQFTAVLVEDGFIRMSSPIDFNEDEHNSNCELKNLPLDSSFCQCFCKLRNFPNVGSSPVNEAPDYPNPLNDDSFTTSQEVTTIDQCPYDISCLSDEDIEEIIEDEPEREENQVIQFVNNIINPVQETIRPHPIIKKRNTFESAHSKGEDQLQQTPKPKVRFNIDLDYEKEREWNRINKMFGDVSKAHIEWTDEVEV